VDPVAAAYERVKARLTEAEFRAKVEAERAAFDGLLDDEALALLVLDELGANEGAYLTLADLHGRTEATVRATVERVEAPRTFERAGRPPGRLVGCAISDATGRARLVLWDRDVEKVEDGTLHAGARVTIVNARVKESNWGLELHVSPWTVLEVEGALDPAKKKLLMDVRADAEPTAGVPKPTAAGPDEAPAPGAEPKEASVEGTVAALAPTRTFRRPDGGVGFVADLDLDMPEGRVRVVLWDEPVRQVRQFLPGARVRVTHCVLKPRGATTEWHTTRDSSIQRAG
jgi:hypothetical protein